MAKKFINPNKYPVSVMDERGTNVLLQPGQTIVGDWYEKFVGPRCLGYFVEGSQDKPVKAVDPARFSKNETHFGKTKTEWLIEINSEAFPRAEYSRGNLLGIAEFLGLQVGAGSREEIGKAIKMQVEFVGLAGTTPIQ